MHRRLVAACAVTYILGLTPVASAALPANWDGLSRVKSKRFDAVYLMPGADFRAYKHIMLDPTEVAFQKNWIRDYNSQSRSLSRRISDADGKKLMTAVRTEFEAAFQKAYGAAGYQVVTAAGPDVLRVRTAVANLYVSSPDLPTAGRSVTYSSQAGGATVVVEVRDSESGALLGRAVDGKIAGDTGPYMRNRVTNTADFRRVFKDWATASVTGLGELKARSPVPAAAQTAGK